MTRDAIVHVAGTYDPDLGQLCSRCGDVLDTGLANKSWIGANPPVGWPEGEEILIAGSFSGLVSALQDDRDTSDEQRCEIPDRSDR